MKNIPLQKMLKRGFNANKDKQLQTCLLTTIRDIVIFDNCAEHPDARFYCFLSLFSFFFIVTALLFRGIRWRFASKLIKNSLLAFSVLTLREILDVL